MKQAKTEDKRWCVYMHTNKANNKVYVGQTCQQPPEKRWGRSGWGYKTNKYFWKAIQKYGFDNFEHIIFADGLTKEEANKMEMMLIRFYETRDPNKGYNLTDGGEGNIGYHPSPETLEKMRIASTNPSEETRRKMSEAKKGKPSHRKGIKLSMEEREKMKEQHKDAQKCVVQIDKDGVCVAEYSSIREAARSTGVPRKGISECCNDKLLTSGGYQWMFKEKFVSQGSTKYSNPIVKPVIQLDKNGEFIARYNSIVRASATTNINKCNISDCCRGELKSAGGFQWIFESDYDALTLKLYEESGTRSVVQLDKSGKIVAIYSSITEASETVGCSESAISHCCRGRYKSVGGYMWVYYEDYEDGTVEPYKRLGRHKPVVQLSLTLTPMSEFPSAKEAAEEVDGYATYITSCCQRKKKTYKGYIWRYKEEMGEISGAISAFSK